MKNKAKRWLWLGAVGRGEGEGRATQDETRRQRKARRWQSKRWRADLHIKTLNGPEVGGGR